MISMNNHPLTLLRRALVIALVCCPPSIAETATTNPPPEVQLALCLDTSGSMSGLIDSARQKLWAVVNDLALIDPAPELRVALLSFGNDGHRPENGWVRIETPFTGDLDLVSERLFALSTDGGTEYVGRVLESASELDWSRSSGALKMVVVAGNESADQDQEVSFRGVCRDLVGREIVVHSIYCGASSDSEAGGWREVARNADGQFATIDQDDGTVVIATPFDDRLGRLSEELNATYIPLGSAGAAGAAVQREQDDNAARFGPAVKAARAVTKSKAIYAPTWDLVEMEERVEGALEEVEEAALPEEMRAMSTAERTQHVAAMKAKREWLQAEIQELDAARAAHIEQEIAKQGLDESQSFDAALRAAVREQAQRKGLHYRTQ